MSPTIKILLAALPFLIAGYVGFSLLQPAMEEANTKDASVAEKKAESEGLLTKIGDSAKMAAKEKQLNADIAALRDAVPKSPDTDLFTIDLERMCKEAGMDLISIGSSKTDGAPSPEQSSILKKKQDKLKNALKGNVDAASDKSAGAETEPVANELETANKQIVVAGDYNGLQKLVHELETYQRVIKINEIVSRIPKAGGKEKAVKLPDDQPLSPSDLAGDPNMLYISMNISTYYLP
ncbi:MAG: hypothetical protein K2X77_26985 [Candidatus Obscuribacterales bacterium]|jgi:hypothetical protein|nr:hypothetical protein [Candidatus Obscuribacterales bacterium]